MNNIQVYQQINLSLVINPSSLVAYHQQPVESYKQPVEFTKFN